MNDPLLFFFYLFLKAINGVRLKSNQDLGMNNQSFSERRTIERHSERALIVSERECVRRKETDNWALSASAP